MIIIENTENLAGVCISGDYNDLNKLVDAFYELAIDEDSETNKNCIELSTRVLGICYDVRHSYQGDREVEFVYNGMDEDKMSFHSMIATKSNIYYKCNYLYPEMFFVMLALNKLVKLRMRELMKTKSYYNEAFDKNIIWDDKIATIRSFQGEFMKCVQEVLTKASFSRWIKLMNSEYISIEEIAGQYVDFVNIEYINMSKEKRLKSLTSIAKRIAQFATDRDYCEIKESVMRAAKYHGCCESDISISSNQYPEEIIW